jgi:hypothetical protein
MLFPAGVLGIAGPFTSSPGPPIVPSPPKSVDTQGCVRLSPVRIVGHASEGGHTDAHSKFASGSGAALRLRCSRLGRCGPEIRARRYHELNGNKDRHRQAQSRQRRVDRGRSRHPHSHGRQMRRPGLHDGRRPFQSDQRSPWREQHDGPPPARR